MQKSDALQYLTDNVRSDEEVFILRAQDIHAPEVVGHWCARAINSGVPEHKVVEAMECALKMRAWQDEHGEQIKNPD